MKDSRPVNLTFYPEAAEAYGSLKRIVAEQKAKGIASSEEMQLMKSIENKLELIQRILCLETTFQKIKYPKRLAFQTCFVWN
jgi:glycerol-3-phosphate responsive antiterminator